LHPLQGKLHIWTLTCAVSLRHVARKFDLRADRMAKALSFHTGH
jgi:hypothetical protein